MHSISDMGLYIATLHTLIRLHLEYCMQFRSPHDVKDVTELERRLTRMLPGFEDSSYGKNFDPVLQLEQWAFMATLRFYC